MHDERDEASREARRVAGFKGWWRAAMSSPVGRTILALLRLWLGWQWFVAGIEKLGDPTWVGAKAGVGISAFLTRAIGLANGAHPSVQHWYASFLKGFALPHAIGFSYWVTFGEIAVGAALMLGLLSSLALVAGMVMNMAYMLAGTTSTNPILFAVAAFLLALGPDTSFEGLDHFLARFYRRWYVRLIEGATAQRGPIQQH